MSRITPNKFEKLSNVVASVELVVELGVRARLFDFCGLGSSETLLQGRLRRSTANRCKREQGKASGWRGQEGGNSARRQEVLEGNETSVE